MLAYRADQSPRLMHTSIVISLIGADDDGSFSLILFASLLESFDRVAVLIWNTWSHRGAESRINAAISVLEIER